MSVEQLPRLSNPVKGVFTDYVLTSDAPWREKRLAALQISDALESVDPRKAARYSRCGERLVFLECSGPDGANHPKWFKCGTFCGQRLCPMCMWLRTVKLGDQVVAMVCEALEQHAECCFVMVTLTQKNVSCDQLRGGVDNILKGWECLTNQMSPDSVMGWIRTLEITLNEGDGTWDQHIHALLLGHSDQWTQTDMTQRKWCDHLAQALGTSYRPVVDVRRVKHRRGRYRVNIEAIVQEISKCPIKEEDILKGDKREIRERILMLEKALRGHQFVEFGGEFKRLAQVISRRSWR